MMGDVIHNVLCLTCSFDVYPQKCSVAILQRLRWNGDETYQAMRDFAYHTCASRSFLQHAFGHATPDLSSGLSEYKAIESSFIHPRLLFVFCLP